MKDVWKKYGKKSLAILLALILACPIWDFQVHADTITDTQDLEVSQLDDLSQYETQEGVGQSMTDLPEYVSDSETPAVYEGSVVGSSTGEQGVNDLLTHVFSNTNNREFLSYLKALESAGWVQYSNNIIDKKNLFATYIIDDDADKNIDRGIYLYYIANKQRTYIVVPESCNFENREQDNAYQKVCEPQITQVMLKSEQYGTGMSYVLRLSDGRFIIIDGGFNEDGHPEELYALLEKQNVRKKVTIAAWILTHPHKDHLGTATGFLGKYNENDVIIEEMIFNFPTYEDGIKAESTLWLSDDTHAHSRVSTFLDNLKLYWPNMKVITCHTGQEYYFADAKIEILHTIEDYYPMSIDELDDSNKINAGSVTFSIEIAGQKIMITGDSSETECNDLVTMWDTYMKSDILQQPHHGGVGSTVEFCECVDPKVVMIPVMRGAISGTENVEGTQWVYNNTGGNIKEVIIQGYKQRTLKLPYIPATDVEYISNRSQNGYAFQEPTKEKTDIPKPYMDLIFDGKNVTNGGVANNLLEMQGGSVGTNTVYYNDKAYDVTSYRAEQGTGGYIHLTMQDITNAEDLENLVMTNGFSFEMFVALDSVPDSYVGLLSNVSSGGISLAIRKTSGILNLQMGKNDSSDNYEYALPADTNFHESCNMVGDKVVTHVVGTYNPKTNMLSLYRNGVLASEASFGDASFQAPYNRINQLGIGKNLPRASEALANETGYTVLRSRIYDVCLSKEQIAAEYWDSIDMLGVEAEADETVTTIESGAVVKFYDDIAPFRQENATSMVGEETVQYYTKAPDAPKGYSDYIFAGWYTDATCEAALKNTETKSGAYYAKFVPKDILGIKAQINDVTGFVTKDSDMRFVTSVDSLNYNVVGFDVEIDGEIKSAQSDTVFRKLIARGTRAEDGKIINYTPDNTFHKMSKYFLACMIQDIPNEDFGRGIVTTPYWITLDGTKVIGSPTTKSVNMGYLPRSIEGDVEKAFDISHKDINAETFISSKNYTTQGGCMYGKYFYQAEFYNAEGLDSISSNDGVYIHKYDMETDSVISSDLLKIGQVNDMTYNEKTGFLVLCYDNQSKITFVNPVELTYDSSMNIDMAISSIDYNALTNRYVVGVNGGKAFCILDENFEIVGRIYNRIDDAINYMKQGIASDDSYIYFSHCNRSVVAVYSWDGQYVTTIDFSNSGVASAEMEDIIILNNAVYLTCNNANQTSVYKVNGLRETENIAFLAEITRDGVTYSYSSLEAAMLDAKNGDVITILDNVTVKSTMDMLADNVTITNVADKDITITRQTKKALIDNRSLGFTIKASENTTLTIDGNDISGKALIINSENASMKLDNISVKSTSEIVCQNAGVVTLSGTLKGVTVKEQNLAALVKLDSDYQNNSTVEIIPTVAQEHQVIAGENISDETLVGMIEAISIATENLTGSWLIDNAGWLKQENCVHLASTDKNYGSLEEAVATATENDKITILQNIILDREIEIDKSLTISSEAEVTVTRKSGHIGNMFRVSSGTLTINGYSDTDRIVFDGNTATKAEAIRAFKVTEGANLVVTNVKIQNFYSSNSGGAIYSAGELVRLDCVEFYKNKATKAGAIHLFVKESSENSVLSVTNCEFDGNESTQGNAGALYLRAKGKTIKFENSVFSKTNKDQEGNTRVADVYANTTLEIRDCNFNNSQVNLLGNESYASVCGKITGLSIQYKLNKIGVKILGVLDDSSNIKILPVKDDEGKYTAGVKLVEATGNYVDEISDIDVASDAIGDWAIDSEGCLISGANCVLLNGTEYYTSLYEAVQVANSTLGEDKITLLKNHTIQNTIEVTDALTIESKKEVVLIRGKEVTGDMFNVTGDGTTFTINGTKSAQIVLEGNLANDEFEAIEGRAVNVASGTVLNMQYVTIQNFLNSTGGGAAILNSGTVSIQNALIDNNRHANYSSGGTIRNQGGTLSITDTVISNGSTNYLGGALYTNNGKVTVTRCEFSGNSGSQGGAIYYNNVEAIDIIDCVFTGNTASYGGALCVYNATIQGAIFSDNYAEISGKDVYLKLGNNGIQGTVTLSGTLKGLTIAYCKDALGIKIAGDINAEEGDIVMLPLSYQSEVQLVSSDNEVDLQTASKLISVLLADGGKCELNAQGYLETDCVAIGAVNYPSLAEALIDANDGDVITLLRDFAITSTINFENSVTITSNEEVTITRSEGFSGDMFKVAEGKTVSIQGAENKKIVVDGNTGESAVEARMINVVSGATLYMEHVTVQNFNSTTNAMVVLNYGTTDLKNVVISNNVTSSNGAGGVLRNEGTMLISNSSITGTQSKGNGGALFASGVSKKTTITSCAFSNNSSTAAGGAIYHNSAKNFEISNCTFVGNRTSSSGAAIAIKSAKIMDSIFVANTANGVDDDLLLKAGSAVVLSGSLDGLTIQYEAESNEVIRVGDALTGDITIIPKQYESDAQVLEKVDDTVSDDGFTAAANLIDIFMDCSTGTWRIDNHGRLQKNGCRLESTGVVYSKLSDVVMAVDSESDADTITLLGDCIVESPITISQSIIITSDKGVTLTKGESLTGNMFNVTGESTVFTIRGSEKAPIIIEGDLGSDDAVAIEARAVNVEAGATCNVEYVSIQNFYNNTGGGAAAYSEGTVVIKNSLIDNNRQTGNAAGGAIRNQGGILEISNTVISNNSTTGDGGAIYTNSRNVTVSNSEFRNNATSKRGGAIYYNNVGALTLNNCVFTGNTAKVYGGALLVYESSIKGATFEDNRASNYGDDLCMSANNDSNQGSTTLSGIIQNLTVAYSADKSGIRIAEGFNASESVVNLLPKNYTKDTVLVQKADTTVGDNIFASATDSVSVVSDGDNGLWEIDDGGRLTQICCKVVSTGNIYHSLEEAVAKTATEDEIILLGNFEINSAVSVKNTLTITSDKDVTLIRGEGLTGNMFDVSAGTLRILGTDTARITIDGNLGNAEAAINARAINVASGAVLSMEYTTIENFYNNTGGGAAIYSAGTVNVKNSMVDNNRQTANAAGGAIRNQGGSLTLENTIISNNSTTGDGGAIYTNNKNVTMIGCEFKNNVAGNRGGVVYYNNSGYLNIDDCLFSGNSAGTYGGALCIHQANLKSTGFENNLVGNRREDIRTPATNQQVSVTLSGTIQGLYVAYNKDENGILINSDFDVPNSSITIIPHSYQTTTALVSAGETTVLETATSSIWVVGNNTSTGAWGINRNGCLEQTDYVAIGSETYESLMDAINAADSNDIIKILRDFTLDTSVVLNEAKVVNIVNGTKRNVTITPTEKFTGNLIDVQKGKINFIGTETTQIMIDGGLDESTSKAVRAVNVAAGAMFSMKYATIQSFFNNGAIGSGETGGAAIHNRGTTALRYVKICNNGTTGTDSGGAIRHREGTLSIENSVITGNISGHDGGVIHAAGSSTVTTISNSVFTNNSAKAERNGGAIYSSSSYITVSGCTFSSNTAANGGALCVNRASVSNSVFEENDLYLYNGGKVTLSGTIKGLRVVYTADKSGITFGSGFIADESKITIVPYSYQTTIALIDCKNSDILVAASKIITVDLSDGAYILNETGYLVQQ